MGLCAPAQARRRKHEPPGDKARDYIEEALIAEPRDQEVCFSPEEHCDTKLLKFIRSAKKSVDIAIYDINLDQLVHELLVKAKTLPLRIVVDRRQAKTERSLVPLLIRAGIDVRYGRQRGIMHNKFAIVDGSKLATGSFNFTHHASYSNNENQVYLFDPGIVGRFQKRFEKIWTEADPPR